MKFRSHCLAVATMMLAGACGNAASWHDDLTYVGPDDRTFPTNPSLSEIVIRFERTLCHGSCPDYMIEIRGNGNVTYHGRNFVLVEGPVEWHLPTSDVAALIEEFRQADYFNLKTEYAIDAHGFSSTIINLRFGERRMGVWDYGGAYCEEDDPDSPCMPASVRELQTAIDKLSRVKSVVTGSAQTIPILEESGFDFSSRRSGRALLTALYDRDVDLARELVKRGAPLSSSPHWSTAGIPQFQEHAILLLPMTGDFELTRTMIDMGALGREEVQQEFLVASAKSGNPEMVRLALINYARPLSGDTKTPWLIAAAEADLPTEGTYWEEELKKDRYAPWIENFDPPAVIRVLLEAGADPKATDAVGNTALHFVSDAESAQVLLDSGANPNATNEDSRTPLHETQHAAVAAALIKAGASVDARDKYRRTPLFDRYDADTVRVLLEAGADIAAQDKFGSTALFYMSNGETADALIAGGADIDAVNANGRSALTTAKSVKAALAILSAGAKTPEDSEAFEKLVDWATRNEANELVDLLTARATNSR